jgi:CRISPR-associated exonuclease Cas4
VEMEEEELWVLVSAIEHYVYCARQCALIHVEQIFEDNLFTLRGRMAHEQVDLESYETTGAIRVERALPIWSHRHKLIGKADVVEFRADGVIYPVEYKSGERRASHSHDAQLCAQALCLEEMFHRDIERGAVYYISTRRRREVVFSPQLRDETLQAIEAIRQLMRSGKMPPAVHDARCPDCSLLDACMPELYVSGRIRSMAQTLYSPDDVFEEEGNL